MAASVPAAIAGTSIDALSVSISNRLSPGFTASPALTNHFEILPSATVSPSCGIRTSIIVSPTLIRHPEARAQRASKGDGPRAAVLRGRRCAPAPQDDD